MKDGHSQRLYPAAPLRTASVPAELPAPRPTGTLLPGPIARAVSFATRSTSLALRVGTAIGAYGLGAAKVTTLSSLELGRGILDGILSRAGRDVYLGSRSEVARADAESVLASNLEALHHTMTRVVFWTSAGFHAAGTTVSTASEISLLFLSVLDQFFGSTDSSKAIASIITLIRREFQNPATGVEGEKVGVVDLILGLCGLAYLQKRCRKMIQEEHRSLGYEEIIWDVVVLKDGERIDTVQEGVRTSNPTRRSFECDSSAYDGLDDDYPEAQLRQQMIKMLPEDAEVSVSTSTTMTKIITVDIRNAPIMPIPSFPGLSIVQSEISEPQPSTPASQGQPSSYRVVYNVSRNKVEKIPATDKTVEPVERVVEEVGGESNLQPPPTPSTLSKVRDKGSLPSTSPVSPSSTEKRSPKGSSLPSTEWHAKEHGANQKRARKPLDEPQTPDKSPCVGTLSSNTEPRGHKLCMKTSGPATKAVEKGTGVSKASRKNSLPSYTNLLNRDSSSDTGSSSKKKSKPKPPWGSHKPAPGRSPRTAARGFNSERTAAALTSNREAPATPQPARLGDPNYFSSTDLGSLGIPSEGGRLCPPKPMSPANDGRRSSVVSLTDTLSVHSFGTPTSPTVRRTEASGGDATGMPSAKRGHRRASSQTASLRPPSIYSLGTRGSQASLLLSSVHAKSAYSDSEALDSLRRSGEVRGMFPEFHLLRNITRYSRFASAVYGHNFLKLMGILKDRPVPNIADEIHHEVRSFAHHVKLPPDSILLASFVDPQGGSDSTGATDTGIPLVHTIALDEESKAVVLTCRGTLGFEDVLADMMCEYDDLVWRGKEYKVHKGIHASARRLLYGGDGRVLITIRAALEQYPDYGLVLCGHSLGGAVTALLGAMLAEPSTSGTGFVISAAEHRRLLNDPGSPEVPTHICLPSGRPIHVYAYGPPATMSPSLQKVTKGLITSVVHGNDMVPYLSLGVLHDFQALALAFKSDNSEAKAEVKRRVWEGLCSGLAEKWYNNATKQKDEDDDNWVYVALKTLRVSMMSSKLLPPGEVFSVETKAVMRRDAFTQPSLDNVGKPATRIILKYIRDVEAYFREVRFGSSMLTDHSPGRYENALRRLALGAIEA
ncbi:hypothetical protein F5Y17DRAFT_444428 [Xylariaceae sp. FL0594]|nr:hypothetical protein F5Y17DRAFT_444428 [Xylariaceae sp. FL0594]